MKITGLMNFGLIPQRPSKKANVLKSNQANFDFENYSSLITSMNKSLVSFGKRINLDEYKDEIKRLHDEGKSTREIASIINCSPAAVNNAVRRWGFGQKGDIYKLNKDNFIELYSEGKSIEEIANITGIKKQLVEKAIREFKSESRLLLAQRNLEKMIELYESGLTQKEIGDIMGCNQNTVSYTLINAGYDTKRKPRTDGVVEPNKAEIIRMYKKGETMRAIAEKFGCSQGGIESALKRWGIESRQKHTLQDYKEEMIQAHNMGASYKEIAEALGCSHTAVSGLFKKWGIK